MPILTRKHYTSCEDLPLYNWIKLVVTNNAEWLYSEPKKPWHKSNDISSIWEKIFEEYSELSADKSADHVLSMVKGITVINNKLAVIQAAINLLAYARPLSDYQPTIQLLKDYGFRFSYSEETIIKDLQLTASSAKTMVIQRQQLEKDYENYESKQSKSTEKDYYNLIAQLSKFLGFPIDAKKTTVYSYISYVEQYKNSIQKDGKRAIN